MGYNVYVFKMNKKLNDGESIYEIQNEYFEDEFKNKMFGRYRIPGHKEDKRYIHINDIEETDYVLFMYNDRFIATAQIERDNNNKYFYKISAEEKKNEWSFIDWEDEENSKLDHYYKFNSKTIHKIPPIEVSTCKDLFNENLKCQTPIQKITIKKGKEKQFENLLSKNNEKWELGNKDLWDRLVKKIDKPSLLKEISLYNYENIHTSFFCNFINENNVYDLGKGPFEKFIEFLLDKATDENKNKLKEAKRINNFNYCKVHPQKKSGSYIPDITIDLTDDESSKIKYHIIIEAKVCAEENIYDDKEKQCKKYYDHFENISKEENGSIQFIYVFLTLRKHKKEDMKYIKITFNDIYDNVYKEYINKLSGEKQNVLNEYLKSFQYLCDPDRFVFDIDEIPPVYIIDKEEIRKNKEKLEEDIYDIVSYKIPASITPQKMVAYRYLLVLIYNMHLIDDETIKKCYANLVSFGKHD